MGIPVHWCGAPQVWAWRAGRIPGFRRSMDRLAVVLPFETALWRSQGVDAHYVGHPALDGAAPLRRETRRSLGLGDGPAAAVMPGSRANEIRRLLGPLLGGARALLRSGTIADARVLVAPSLDDVTRGFLLSRAAEAGIPAVETDSELGARPFLAAFDLALTASGTATLEASLAGAAPVVVYRVDALTAALARRWVRVPDVALPNVVLGRREYPELLQDEVTADAIARAGRLLLERGSTAHVELARVLSLDDGLTVGDRVARLLRPWIR
jgi:lipid-A-disaccharide synthase